MRSRPYTAQLVCARQSRLSGRRSSSAKGGILADDMGLDKTNSILALMTSRPQTEKRGGHTEVNLIVEPVALIRPWQAEIKERLRPDHRLRVFLMTPIDIKAHCWESVLQLTPAKTQRAYIRNGLGVTSTTIALAPATESDNTAGHVAVAPHAVVVVPQPKSRYLSLGACVRVLLTPTYLLLYCG